MRIPPIVSGAIAPNLPVMVPGLLQTSFSLGKTNVASGAGLPSRTGMQALAVTVKFAAQRETRRARRERLRAGVEADRMVRKARREEVAVKKRIRQQLRVLAAFEDSRTGRIRLAYSASELYHILQTAERLNVQV